MSKMPLIMTPTPLPAPPGLQEEVKVDLFPWSAKFALVCAVVTVGVMWVVSSTVDGPIRWTEVDPEAAYHCRSAVLLLFSAVITELCFLASSGVTLNIVDDFEKKNQLRLHGAGDSMLTLAEYGFKFVCGMYIYLEDGGIMHADQLAWGGPRPVYLGRFIQWGTTVPILILISNRAFLAEIGMTKTIQRSAPALLLSSSYCWAAWLMEVTPSPTARWLLFFLVLFDFLVVCIDQTCLVLQHSHVSSYNAKVGMIVYQFVTFTFYSFLFTLGRFNMIGATNEQMMYAYMDATIKVFQGAILAMIRNWEDLRTIRHWWMEAVTAKDDFERLVRSACVPIFSVTPEGLISSWNDNMTTLTGHSLDAVRDRHLSELLFGGESHDAFSALLAAPTETPFLVTPGSSPPGTQMLELSVTISEGLRVDGRSARALMMSVVPQFSQDREVESYVAIGQDMSEICDLKAVEAKKSQLMAVVSHELRSPLHGMIGLTGMMMDSASQSQRRQLQMVKACASRLLDLVTNVMDLTESDKRKRSGIAFHKPQIAVDFAKIAEEAVVMTTLAVDKANKPLVCDSVVLKNEICDLKQIPIVLGDPYKCTQLLYNLLTNSCKFTRHGTVIIRARHLPEQKLLEIDVVDTGSGISEEAQHRIFKPFEQVHSSAGDARNFQGVGLGLSVCLEIMQQHGAQIRVQSAVGRGSTFTLSFHCQDEMLEIEKRESLSSEMNRKKAAAAKEFATGDESPAVRKNKMKDNDDRRPCVLSVDDDKINQEVIKTALEKDYDIVEAMDGQEALDYLNRCSKEAGYTFPDIVLLDIQMPGLTGFDVCSEIRAKYEKSKGKLPVIMLSARAPRQQTACDSLDYGSTDFMSKPFDVNLLKRKVAVALAVKAEIILSGSELRDHSEETEQKVAEAENSNPKAALYMKQALLTAASQDQSDMLMERKLAEQAAELALLRRANATLTQELQQERQLGQSATQTRSLTSDLLHEDSTLEVVVGPAIRSSARRTTSDILHCQEALGGRVNGETSKLLESASEPSMQCLYQEIMERDEVILNLTDQLARHRTCCKLVDSQLQRVKEIALSAQLASRSVQDVPLPALPSPPTTAMPRRRRPLQSLMAGVSSSQDYAAVG